MRKGYLMDIKHRATFNKSGNIKLGNTWNFSTVYGNDLHETTFNGEYMAAVGTCGKHCEGCNPMIYINGEYYEIKPDTIPNQDTEKSENLPF